MTILQFFKIMFCGCCEPELFFTQTTTTNLVKTDPPSRVETDNLIPPGSKSQVKYMPVDCNQDSNNLSDSTDNESNSSNDFSNINNFRSSFDSNESWEVTPDTDDSLFGDDIY